jgi:hypothetical protein
MVRIAKVAIGLVVAVLSGGIVLAYLGKVEPFVSPSQLPGNPVYGFAAILVLFVAGGVLSDQLDRRAWLRMGRKVGLSAEGGLLPTGQPDLTGVVRGRPMRVRTVSGGGSGPNSSSTTYTVVETDLERPVEWSGMFGAGEEGMGSRAPDTGAVESTTIDGEFWMWGDVSEDVARAVLSGRVRDALGQLDSSSVSVGDVQSNLLAAVRDSIPEDSGSMTGSIASGMLDVAGVDGESGPATVVMHRTEGFLLNADTLERRAEAVAAVADEVERTDATKRPCDGTDSSP